MRTLVWQFSLCGPARRTDRSAPRSDILHADPVARLQSHGLPIWMLERIDESGTMWRSIRGAVPTGESQSLKRRWSVVLTGHV